MSSRYRHGLAAVIIAACIVLTQTELTADQRAFQADEFADAIYHKPRVSIPNIPMGSSLLSVIQRVNAEMSVLRLLGITGETLDSMGVQELMTLRNMLREGMSEVRTKLAKRTGSKT